MLRRLGGDVGADAVTVAAAARPPRSGEFFAPLPLAALALMVVNDVWLKPAFHSALTGKLSDVALCFFMPLLLSELLGIVCGWPPRRRLLAGAGVTAALFVALEIVPPFTRLVVSGLDGVGPYLGIHRRFRMTADWTDLACVPLVAAAVAYGQRRLSSRSAPRV
jgi:hypothetical protein